MNSFNFTTFHFLRPNFLWLAVGMAIFLGICWVLRNIAHSQVFNSSAQNGWKSICSKEILQLFYTNTTFRSSRFQYLLLSIFWLVIICALAGPTWTKKESILYQNQDSWIIALSLSPSMELTDVTPSRLQRAKFKIQDFSSLIKDEQLALVVFGEEAYDIIPLTTDKKTIAHILPSIEPLIMPSKGSNINAALLKAQTLINNLNLQSSNILLLTDHRANSESIMTAKKLADNNIGINIVNLVKTPDDQNNSLKELSTITNGYYTELSNDDSDLTEIISHAALRYKSIYDYQPGQEKTEIWYDMGPWLMLLALPLLILLLLKYWRTNSTLMGIAIHVVLGYFISSLVCLNFYQIYAAVNQSTNLASINSFESADTKKTSLWRSLWFNKQQLAAEKLQNNQALSTSTNVFANKSWQAAAEYKQGQYQKAESLLKDNMNLNNKYNYANSLAQQGKLEEAISVYQQIITTDPNFTDAKYNKELLEKYLQSQNQQSPDQSDQKQQQNNKDRNQNQNSEQNNTQNSEQSENQDSNKNKQQDQDPNQQANKNPDDGNSMNASPKDQQQSNQNDIDRDQKSQNPNDVSKNKSKNSDDSQPKTEQQKLEQAQSKKEQELNKWLDEIPDNPAAYLRNQLQYEYWRQRQIDNF